MRDGITRAGLQKSAKVGLAAAMVATALGFGDLSPAKAEVAAPAASASTLVAALGDAKVRAVGTNAPGVDDAGDRNAEFVWFVNTTGAALDVEGWVLHDAYQTAGGDWGNRYTFKGTVLPAGSPFRTAGPDTVPGNADDRFVMPAGGQVIVYNGSGVDSSPTSTTAAIYRNFKHHYNNGGDTIYLRTDKDAPGYIFRYKYSPYRVDISQ